MKNDIRDMHAAENNAANQSVLKKLVNVQEIGILIPLVVLVAVFCMAVP